MLQLLTRKQLRLTGRQGIHWLRPTMSVTLKHCLCTLCRRVHGCRRLLYCRRLFSIEWLTSFLLGFFCCPRALAEGAAWQAASLGSELLDEGPVLCSPAPALPAGALAAAAAARALLLGMARAASARRCCRYRTPLCAARLRVAAARPPLCPCSFQASCASPPCQPLVRCRDCLWRRLLLSYPVNPRDEGR